MNKETARMAFEQTYELEKKYAKPNGITREYDRGVMKGIVKMAFLSRIITQEEMKAYLEEIKEIYARNKSCHYQEEMKKAE